VIRSTLFVLIRIALSVFRLVFLQCSGVEACWEFGLNVGSQIWDVSFMFVVSIGLWNKRKSNVLVVRISVSTSLWYWTYCSHVNPKNMRSVLVVCVHLSIGTTSRIHPCLAGSQWICYGRLGHAFGKFHRVLNNLSSAMCQGYSIKFMLLNSCLDIPAHLMCIDLLQSLDVRANELDIFCQT